MTRFVGLIVVIIAMVIPGTVLALAPGGSFVDDDGNVHEGNIEAIAAAGITKSCNPPTNDRFCPDRFVTRGEMAAFLRRTLDLNQSTGDSFIDDDTSVFEQDIEQLAAYGITRGCNPPTNDRFCPDRSVTRGEMAAFLVRAYGYPAGPTGRFVDDDDSLFEAEIEALAAAGVTLGCNPPDNTRYCPNNLVRRDEMASFLARAEGLTPIQPEPRGTIGLEEVAGSFNAPMQVVAATGDDRLFVVQRGGLVRVVVAGVVQTEPFLDLTGIAISGGERGLLSMALHPDFLTNGLVYVSYSAESASTSADHMSVVAEYRTDDGETVNPVSKRVIFELDQPYANHNGGMIQFAGDGTLYLGLGDGGSGNDPHGHGQNTATLLGSMVRIDVDSAAVELWASGVRNPWRWWIDGDLMYVGDVGQSDWEEVSVVALSDTQPNLGWDVYEGFACSSNCGNAADYVFPVLVYGHNDGCSITGGVVYRGSISELDGRFLYGDYCSGWVRSVLVVNGVAVEERSLPGLGSGFGLVSFGVDGYGEAYLIRGETISRIV